jgi:hypothetical protein
MRKVLLGLLVLAGLVIGMGVYLKWFGLKWFGLSPQGGEGDKATPSVTVDKEKIKADLEQAKQKAKELTGKVKEKAKELTGKVKEKVKGIGTAAQENPTGPASAPAVETKGD